MIIIEHFCFIKHYSYFPRPHTNTHTNEETNDYHMYNELQLQPENDQASIVNTTSLVYIDRLTAEFALQLVLSYSLLNRRTYSQG